MHGRNFKIIAEKLGTRTVESVTTKVPKILLKMDRGELPADKEFQDSIRPLLSHKHPPSWKPNPWSTDEETLLISIVKEQGRDFKKISEQIKDRTAGSCKHRVEKILKDMKKGKISVDADF